jgi:hypothetical protein
MFSIYRKKIALKKSWIPRKTRLKYWMSFRAKTKA